MKVTPAMQTSITEFNKEELDPLIEQPSVDIKVDGVGVENGEEEGQGSKP